MIDIFLFKVYTVIVTPPLFIEVHMPGKWSFMYMCNSERAINNEKSRETGDIRVSNLPQFLQVIIIIFWSIFDSVVFFAFFILIK